jgi:hypothetical protein
MAIDKIGPCPDSSMATPLNPSLCSSNVPELCRTRQDPAVLEHLPMSLINYAVTNHLPPATSVLIASLHITTIAAHYTPHHNHSCSLHLPSKKDGLSPLSQGSSLPHRLHQVLALLLLHPPIVLPASGSYNGATPQERLVTLVHFPTSPRHYCIPTI